MLRYNRMKPGQLSAEGHQGDKVLTSSLRLYGFLLDKMWSLWNFELADRSCSAASRERKPLLMSFDGPRCRKLPRSFHLAVHDAGAGTFQYWVSGGYEAIRVKFCLLGERVKPDSR